MEPENTTSTDSENIETPGNETPPEGENQSTGEAEPKGEANEEGNEKPEEKPEEGDDEDSKLDLDGAKKALSDVRKEAAKYRTKLRELEAQFKDAKSPDDVQAIIDKLTTDNATETRVLLVENVALKAGLAKEFHDRLKGNTREELEADAKSLAKLVGAKSLSDPDVSGGLTPGGDPEVFDEAAAREAARKAKRNRR